MISVCMAVYNGENFILQQLSSILCQLGAEDEVIIIDDCSSDNSAVLIGSINDIRIKYYKNAINLGVFGTFERAINESCGDIIFLSDQDDIWYPKKVEKVTRILDNMEKITMVATDAALIDGEGVIKCDSFFSMRGRFKPGLFSTIIKNKYLGCTLAFRKSLVNKLLPIPKSVPMHDIWFGALNSLVGKTYFIDEPLIYYRRHNDNLSPIKPVNLLKRFIWRFSLVKNLSLRCIVLCRKELMRHVNIGI
jgi:glycosyltransferase involved in cell wall biosynthesis